MSATVLNDLEYIPKLVANQHQFFNSGKTKSIEFRKEQLKRLKTGFHKYEKEILEALYSDLRKNEFEAYATEVGLVIGELDHMINELSNWARPKSVRTPLFMFKAKSFIKSEPYGTVMVMAPWNYPFQLLFSPVVGAIAAGNTVILKPSELAPATSAVAKLIIEDAFEPEYVAVVEGAIPESQALLKEKFDFIFFTGSTQVGRIVYQAAAKHLTPVTLELGGKSPCIVDRDVPIAQTARKIVFGKFINSGQTCIAPDYLLVDKRVKSELIEAIKNELRAFYSDDIQESPDYCRIISERHFDRLVGMIEAEKIVYGGATDKADLYIEPTILTDIDMESPLMQEEIFGPLLPVLEYEKLDDAIQFVNDRPKPLALYLFSKNQRKVDKVLNNTSSGGVTVNDTIMHLVNPNLPFGGVGESGMGGYHGKYSFELFSHQKSVLHRSFIIDAPMRYPPFKIGLGLLKKMMKFTIR